MANRYLKIELSTQIPYSKEIRRLFQNFDNKLSHNDTLYVHNWWADLNVYNYEEAILLENWNKNARECWALSNTPKDVQLPPQPRVHGIRFIDYFCGNKDWIVQLGPI